MLELKAVRDKKGHIVKIQTSLTGADLLSTPSLNKDNAFSNAEREAFGLLGKLPDAVETIEEQEPRHYKQYSEIDTDLGKNIYLNQLYRRNRTLFYYLTGKHLEEMMPIVYTPTVGEAVEKFSLELRSENGIFISYDHKDRIEEMLNNRHTADIDLILVTDGEGVLGIGDQGVGGMNIAIGKLMVYTLCAGINPNRVLPIQLDIGTNNEKLLNDPMYLGMRKNRISGKDYDDFIDAFVTAVMKVFPDIYLHWEDFGRDNARKNLQRWRPKLLTFNDDMQGTGATSLACGLSAVAAKNEKLKDQRIVFFGAGTAGCGIADQYCAAMVHQGLSKEEACARIYMIDRPGLLVEDMKEVLSFQAPYAKSRKEVDGWNLPDPHAISLLKTIIHSKTTILVGCSGVHGAFNEDVIKAMADNAQHPVIFPLSNPTSLSEADPKMILELTKGNAIVATGSPFPDVTIAGRTIRISQSNNAFVFPGLGLGAMAVKAKHMTDNMIHAACHALSELSPARKDKSAPVLPDINDVREVSLHIARAVAQQAIDDGETEACDVELAIQQIRWEAEYFPYELK